VKRIVDHPRNNHGDNERGDNYQRSTAIFHDVHLHLSPAGGLDQSNDVRGSLFRARNGIVLVPEAAKMPVLLNLSGRTCTYPIGRQRDLTDGASP
jgi:hypothetical protein